MRKAPILVAALSLALTGCSFSKLDADEQVNVSGRALDAAGKPLSDTQVLLFKQADLGGLLFGTVFAIGSLGTACLLPQAPAICRKARTTTTDADGRYEFELKGEDTQGSLGTAATLNVVFAARGKAATSTTVSFGAEDGTVELPDARLWRAAPQASGGRGEIRLSWSALPRSAGSKAGYSAQLYDAGTGAFLWSQDASGRRTTIDTRLVEDHTASAAIGASATLPGGTGTGTVRASYLSARIPAGRGAGAPPSRNRPCAAVSGTGPVTTGAFSRCGATDGNLTKAARLSGKGVVSGVVVDLGSVRPVDLVVARGFAGQLLLEVSDDGRNYRMVASTADRTAALEPPAGTTGRFVRFRSPTGLDQSLSSELSIW